MLNIPLTYVIVDVVVLIGIVKHEQIRRARRRLEEEEENSGNGLENIRTKLADIRKSEEK